MQNTIKFTLDLVIDRDDERFYFDRLPRLFMMLEDTNTLMNIKNWAGPAGGWPEFELIGTKDAIRQIIIDIFDSDDGWLDMLDEIEG